MDELGRFNYIRNSVKATVDAYDGDVHMYIFDHEDPLINAYQHLFPELFTPGVGHARRFARACPGARRCCSARRRKSIRTYHMRDPESYLQSRRPVGSGDLHRRRRAASRSRCRRPIW